MSRPTPLMAVASLEIQLMPPGTMPPGELNALLVNELTSSAIDTSSRSEMSRAQVTAISGSCSVWSRRSSSPIRKAPVESMVAQRSSNVMKLSVVKLRPRFRMAGEDNPLVPSVRVRSSRLLILW